MIKKKSSTIFDFITFFQNITHTYPQYKRMFKIDKILLGCILYNFLIIILYIIFSIYVL